ncbi:MAG: S8 family peptidase [Actinomycetota bacterium]
MAFGTDDGRAEQHGAHVNRLVSHLLFETPSGTRFTQDSPILPHVWLSYAEEPLRQTELILTTVSGEQTGLIANHLRDRLSGLRDQLADSRGHIGFDRDGNPIPRQRARVAYIPGQIACKVYFDELLRVVLPLTPWWHEAYDNLRSSQHRYNDDEFGNWFEFPRPDPTDLRTADLVDALMLFRRDVDPFIDVDDHYRDESTPEERARRNYIRSLPSGMLGLIRVAGPIAEAFLNNERVAEPGSAGEALYEEVQGRLGDRIETSQERHQRLVERGVDRDTARETRRQIVESFQEIYRDWASDDRFPTERQVWRVTKNRRVHLAVNKSALTVKADAARSLFDISCSDITWAVLDSGIDHNHPAFRLTNARHEEIVRDALSVERAKREGTTAPAGLSNPPDHIRQRVAALEELPPEGDLPLELLDNRIIKTLDFTYLRELLDFDIEYDSENHADEAEERHLRLAKKIACRMWGETCRCDLSPDDCGVPDDLIERAEELLASLRQRIKEGKDIDWQDLEDAIVAERPPIPTNDHGTHVAGILGADWIEDHDHEVSLPLASRTRRMTGVCPDINLIDVRVFREDGLTDEFELLAALQYLRWMNSRAGNMLVHGANLSLSLIHEVRRFACGQTPICDECNEATALGMTVVVAAGNRGFDSQDFGAVTASDSYRSVSITDPGNAERVITVGATHRKRPHEYGVSYFSSRGPTGDGRLKPDLVAPGEKISGPTPNGQSEFKDGTSMAAPHVSGAAALLMARHTELIGKPDRIKQILCDTATDLGRERYFQGHGLVDALRALQSV